MSDIITVTDLVKKYKDGTEAVKKVSFSVKEGEFFGFLGPNGAGKSTTIKVLTTLLKKTSGVILVDNIDVSKKPINVRKIIGYSAQEIGVDDELTGLENIRLQGRLYHQPEPEVISRGDELLELLDLSNVANKRTGFYSGGMRKRLDIGLALMHNPKVLFLDEPTTGLDPQTRVNLWEYLSKINKEEGVTIFLTTHYMDEADKLCRNLAIIDHGEIIAEGSPQKLKADLGGSVIDIQLTDPLKTDYIGMQEKLKIHVAVKEMKVSDRSLTIYSNKGEGKLSELLSIITEFTKLENISFSGPTLDDVFIKLTGRKIRDEHGKPADFFTKQRRASGRMR